MHWYKLPSHPSSWSHPYLCTSPWGSCKQNIQIFKLNCLFSSWPVDHWFVYTFLFLCHLSDNQTNRQIDKQTNRRSDNLQNRELLTFWPEELEITTCFAEVFAHAMGILVAQMKRYDISYIISHNLTSNFCYISLYVIYNNLYFNLAAYDNIVEMGIGNKWNGGPPVNHLILA